MMTQCAYCRSKLEANSADGRVRVRHCLRCERNESKYGKPVACAVCGVVAAFRGGKCVHCTHSERKYGAPHACSVCKQHAAFASQQHNLKRVCRLCSISFEKGKLKTKNRSAPQIADVFAATNRSLASAKGGSENGGGGGGGGGGGSLADVSGQLVMQSQLKEQLDDLKRRLVQKDAELMERDKKIAQLNARLSHESREQRMKAVQQQRQHQDVVEQYQKRVNDLTRQMAVMRKQLPKKSVAIVAE